MNIDRFVDDISGHGKGDPQKFEEWVQSLRQQIIASIGLDITFKIQPIIEFTQLLDIDYKIIGGRLNTDVFHKETDANH